MDELSAANVVVLGVSFDSVNENAAFAEKFEFPFPLLCDTDRELGVAYHAADSHDTKSARRISYLIDEEGRIAAAWSQVDPASHPNEVLEQIRGG